MPTKLWENTPTEAAGETLHTGDEINGLWDDQFTWRNTSASHNSAGASIATDAGLLIQNNNLDIKIGIAGVEDFSNSLM